MTCGFRSVCGLVYRKEPDRNLSMFVLLPLRHLQYLLRCVTITAVICDAEVEVDHNCNLNSNAIPQLSSARHPISRQAHQLLWTQTRRLHHAG
jgi:hypothetical protein